MKGDPENQQRILAALAAHSLDALICSLPHQVLLLTGYWPVMANSVAIFTRAGEMHLLLPEDEADLAAQMSVAQRTMFRPGSLAEITTARQAIVSPLVDLIGRLGLQRAHFGMAFNGTEHPVSYLSQYSYQDRLKSLLEAHFSGSSIVSADALLHHLAGVKTKVQLEAIRLACRVAGDAYRRASEQWSASMREPEIAEVFRSAYATAAIHPDVARSDAYFFCMSGENAATADAAFARTRQRTVRNGDAVMIHCNSNVNGYWTDVTRTYVCGPYDSRHQAMQHAIAQAGAAALARIAPGIPAAEVDRAARDVLQEHGFGPNFTHGAGHGVGFSAANHDAIPRIHPQSSDILESGMTFNIEPAIYLEGQTGMRHCDVVALTPGGVEVLTDF